MSEMIVAPGRRRERAAEGDDQGRTAARERAIEARRTRLGGGVP